MLGCDMEGAMNRFLQDDHFYQECYGQVMREPAFDLLKEAIQSGDSEQAFHYAHTLKGVIANMGLTPLYEIIVKIVDILRQGTTDGLLPLCEELLQKRDIFRDFLTEPESR
jgi:chemotaxis protein histidine kinase CheA